MAIAQSRVLTCQLLLHCLLKCGVKLKVNMHVVKYNSNSCYICKQYFIVRKFSTVLYDAENMTQTGAHLTHFDKTRCYLEIVKWYPLIIISFCFGFSNTSCFHIFNFIQLIVSFLLVNSHFNCILHFRKSSVCVL